MKTTIIVTLILALLLILFQAFVLKSTKDVETLKYQVLQKYDEFEIRKYSAYSYSYVKMNSNSYKETSSKGFRALAGYIFGGNDRNEKIAMTSPVAMNISDTTTMMFMLPSEVDIEKVPIPKNEDIKFNVQKERTVAAITFGGWANDEKIALYTEQLKKLLKENNIEHDGNFSYLGYNPPFEVVNRRNEIIVGIE